MTTDLKSVKQVAKMLLMIDPSLTEFSPAIIQHPFSSCGVVPIEENGEMKMVDITESRGNFDLWVQHVSKQIDAETSAFRVYSMVNKPYALTFLRYADPHLSRDDLSVILYSAWSRSENPNMDPNVNKKILLSMFRRADPELLMDKSERAFLESLDEEVTVYRGVTSYNKNTIKALSWTLSKDTTEWFAHRFGEEGTVYEAEINKKHILAYFSQRQESEVIVDPKYLLEIHELGEDLNEGQGGMVI